MTTSSQEPHTSNIIMFAPASDVDKDVTLLSGYGSPDHLAVEADVDAPVDRERFHDAKSPGVRGGRPETGSAIAHFDHQPGAKRDDAQADRGRAVQDSVGDEFADDKLYYVARLQRGDRAPSGAGCAEIERQIKLNAVWIRHRTQRVETWLPRSGTR